MIFSKLSLTAFGPFTDYVINFSEERPFNILFGLNEAGKSTILRATTDFLYGFPNQSQDSYLHATSNLRIQACVKYASGKELVLMRRKGKKNTLMDHEGKPQDDVLLQQLLGHIDKNLFLMMFGMDHHALRKGGENILKGGGAVGESLFEAASGISGLRDIFRKLEDESGKLYKPQSSKMFVNAKINEYKEVKARITAGSLRPPDWKEREKAYQEDEFEVRELREKINKLRGEKTKLERLNKTLPLIAKRKEYLNEIGQLQGVPILPASFRDERLKFLDAKNKSLLDKEKVERDIEKLGQRIAGMSVPTELLKSAEQVNNLQERLDTYRTYLKEIPERQGEVEELERGAIILLREINPSLSSLSEAEALKIPSSVKNEIRELGSVCRVLEEKLEAAESRVDEYGFSLLQIREEKEKIGTIHDLSELKNVAERAQKQGDLENELVQARTDSEILKVVITKAIGSLGLWSGTIEEAEVLPLPLPETIRLFEQDFQRLTEELRKIAESIGKASASVAVYEKKLIKLELTGELPTEDNLSEARNRRQKGWQLVRRSWLEGDPEIAEEKAFDPENTLSVAYELSVTEADNVADSLRSEADRVAEKASCLESIAHSEDELSELRKKRIELEGKSSALNDRWVKAWHGTKISPLSPNEMLAWSGRYQNIVSRINELNKAMAKVKNLQDKIAIHISELSIALLNLGEANTAKTLASHVSRAQEVREASEKNKRILENYEKSRIDFEAKLKKAQQEHSKVEKSLHVWREKWSAAMSQLALSADTTPEVASALLDKLEELFQKIDTANIRKHEMEKKKGYTADFVCKAASLLETLAQEFSDMPAEIAVSRLKAKVDQAKLDATTLTELHNQMKKARTASEEIEKRISEVCRGLNSLRARAGGKELSELEHVESQSRRLVEINNNLRHLDEQLWHLGSGHSLEEILTEADGVDGDMIAGIIVDVERELEALDEKRSQLEQRFGVTRQTYEELLKGTRASALEAAEEAQSIIADLRPLTEQYLQLRLAAIVLQRAIDRYRDENQNPVIRRSSEIFAELTLSSFAALKVDFDDSDNAILLGVRPTGETVRVEGMSDGTRDQLYLALRLASIERYLESHEPVPLILDDLLVNFDDQRAAKTLRILAKLAEKTQILFFTHHNSLLNLARDVIPAHLLTEHCLER